MNNPTLPTTRELAQLRPAEVIVRPVHRHRAPARTRPQPGQHVETLIGSHRTLDRELARLGRGVLGHGERHLIPSGQHAGLLELRVIVKDAKRTPRWAKVCIALGATLLVLSAVFAALAYVLSALDLRALGIFAVVVVGALFALVKGGGGGRARGVFVQVTTSVHVR